MRMDGRIAHFSQTAYIRRYTLSAGAEAGLRIIEADNGKLRFLLNESKALDIAQLWHEGSNVSYLSKNGLSPREIPFAGRFEGGMLYTCGPDSVGDRAGYELHGTLHNTPALVTRASCDENGITVEAEVRCTQLFGRNLRLTRRYFTAVGSDTLEIRDTLTNLGYTGQDYCLLYHVNLGYPMLDAGARISADVRGVRPRTPFAARQAEQREVITAPVAGQEETCYFLDLGAPLVSLYNPRSGKRFTLAWSQASLPHFVEWKSMASGDYALGLEPATTELDGAFRYKTLAPQASAEFALTMRVFRSED